MYTERKIHIYIYIYIDLFCGPTIPYGSQLYSNWFPNGRTHNDQRKLIACFFARPAVGGLEPKGHWICVIADPWRNFGLLLCRWICPVQSYHDSTRTPHAWYPFGDCAQVRHHSWIQVQICKVLHWSINELSMLPADCSILLLHSLSTHYQHLENCVFLKGDTRYRMQSAGSFKYPEGDSTSPLDFVQNKYVLG